MTLHRTNDDIVWFLLRMIWQGEVVGALNEAKQFALNAQNKYTRFRNFNYVENNFASRALIAGCWIFRFVQIVFGALFKTQLSNVLSTP